MKRIRSFLSLHRARMSVVATFSLLAFVSWMLFLSHPVSALSKLTNPESGGMIKTPRNKSGDDGRRGALDAISLCANHLRWPADPQENARLLGLLQVQLSAISAPGSSAGIQAYLATHADTSTGARFEMGRGGVLSQWPTLRVFLLDFLGQVDPSSAATEAREMLRATTSPDEWAINLRNLARGDPSESGRHLLAEKTHQMLSFLPWREHPSSGFLEAFDVPVYLEGTDFVPMLAGLTADTNRALAHAAELALDRLVIVNTTPLFSAFLAQPDLLNSKPLLRASFFARANLLNESERRSVEEYLLQPGIGSDELTWFASSFPNDNFRVSHNLLTANLSETLGKVNFAARDRAALGVIESWQRDGRFKKVFPELELMHGRVAEFVAQASSGGTSLK